MKRARLRQLIFTASFTALMVVGAQVRVPMPLVPFSLQTFFVMLAGSVLGPYFGASSQILYLALGLIGLPVFAKGGGLAYIFQPTFGYLLAFPLASFIAGRLIHGKNRHAFAPPEVKWPRLLWSNAVASAAILALGTLYLWISSNTFLGVKLDFVQAVWAGGVIFLPGDVLKIILVASLYRAIQPRLAASLQLLPDDADIRDW